MKALHIFATLIVLLGVVDEIRSAEFLNLGPGRAYTVSDDGSVVTGVVAFSASPPWRWTPNEGRTALPNDAIGVRADGTFWTAMDAPVSLETIGAYALNISADGSVIIGAGNLGAFRATLADGLEPLNPPPGNNESTPQGLSADETVIVGTSRPFPPAVPNQYTSEATVWVREAGQTQTIGLGRPDGLATWARYVSRDGSTVVGGIGDSTIDHYYQVLENSIDEPFRWTQETGIVSLGRLSGTTHNTPAGISSDASVIVGNTNISNRHFIWDQAHGIRDLWNVVQEQHGVRRPTGFNSLVIWAMSADARTLVGGTARACSNCSDQAWALFLDRPIHVALSDLTPGDYNANAVVEQADLDLVLLNWGTELLDPAAIGWDHDAPTGPIDQGELDSVLLNWGRTPVMLATNSVPEPSSLALILSLLAASTAAIRMRSARRLTQRRC